MIISSSSIGMDSVRTYTSVSKESRKFEGGLITSFAGTIQDNLSAKKGENVNEEVDKAEGQESAKDDFDSIYEKMKSYATSGALEAKMERDAISKIKAQCLQYLLYILFGREILDEDLELSEEASTSQSEGQLYSQTFTETYSFSYMEEESTSFSTKGKVVTGDGREIEFNLDVSMSRSFSTYYEKQSKFTQVFTDPLVINLDGNVADVSDIKVLFDLDSDGEAEMISVLSQNSGYLALDKNGDGIINDGSELFGTSSGDGFMDLAQYDEDKNGWIDEADDIFDKLNISIWDENGKQTNYSLKEKGVGAIALANASTEFSLNSLESNVTNARIRKTGIFLYENGGIGTVQHLDLAQ